MRTVLDSWRAVARQCWDWLEPLCGKCNDGPMAKADASVIETLVHLNQNGRSKRMSKFKGSLLFFLLFFSSLFFFLSDII
jgi:hypothetical protein